MRTLYVMPPGFGLQSASPFSHKAMLLLNMAGLDYTLRVGNPLRTPKGKLPVLDDAGEIVPDSGFIRLHVERKYGMDLDAGLTPSERAVAHSMRILFEEHLYWVLVYARWREPENARRMRDTFLASVPTPIRQVVFGYLSRHVGRQLWGHGMGRHARDEIYRIGEAGLQAVTALLGEKPYLMGSAPTAIDATAYAFLAGMNIPELPSPLQQVIASRPTLTAYIERCRGTLETPDALRQRVA